MPEGHKTHFLAREHAGWFEGQSLRVTSPQGRFRGDARKVHQNVLEKVEAVGKHLFYHFDGGRIVHVHLGRYGKFRTHDVPVPKPVGKVRMRLVGQSRALDLNGPTTCRVIDGETRDEVVAKLGPDPLAGGRKRDVWETVQGSRKPIAALLLDQSVVAGVGNIFRAEVLFEVGMNPHVTGAELARGDFDALWKSLLKMMRTGLKYGKIITVTSREAGKPLAQLKNNERFRIYGKTDCPSCGGLIETTEIASRKLYWCPTCQS